MNKQIVAAVLLAMAIPVGAIAQMGHVATQADNLKWGPAPPSLPPGAQIAILSGDPGKKVPYVVRGKHPAGYKIPAHTHPQDEHLTVISGSFHFGRGPKLDETRGEKVTAGGYVLMPKGMQHYLWFTEDTILQVHGIGPIDFTYVNPADDPRKKK
jgi:quercetin dioxygenase-like cupin family protein